nr:hypothetical protein [Anaerolineae bacterium]
MTKFDAHKEMVDAIHRRISDLNEQSLDQISQYISYLKWQEELWHGLLDEEVENARPGQSLLWQYDFINLTNGSVSPNGKASAATSA